VIRIERNSNTAILVLHEIYGLNQHIKEVCEYYAKEGFDVICPDLIGKKIAFEYSQEAIAYKHFMENVGFEKTKVFVERIIKEERIRYKKIFLLGYSMGATVAWICSENENICDGIIGIYGSRIRDYQGINPQNPTLLIFPEEESSFQVKKLVFNLKDKQNTEIEILPGKHGFCDQFSANYLPTSENMARKLVGQFIKEKHNRET